MLASVYPYLQHELLEMVHVVNSNTICLLNEWLFYWWIKKK